MNGNSLLRHAGRSGLVFFVAAALACGDGIKNKKPTFAVTGKVLVQSQPGVGAMLIFRPADGKDAPAEWPTGFPRATVKADGTFTVETYGIADGAPAGDYVVLANWPPPVADDAEEPETPEGEENPYANDRLNGAYMDPATTVLRAKIEAKPNELPTFELMPGTFAPIAPRARDPFQE